jgi:hypothetical protein
MAVKRDCRTCQFGRFDFDGKYFNKIVSKFIDCDFPVPDKMPLTWTYARPALMHGKVYAPVAGNWCVTDDGCIFWQPSPDLGPKAKAWLEKQ